MLSIIARVPECLLFYELDLNKWSELNTYCIMWRLSFDLWLELRHNSKYNWTFAKTCLTDRNFSVFPRTSCQYHKQMWTQPPTRYMSTWDKNQMFNLMSNMNTNIVEIVSGNYERNPNSSHCAFSFPSHHFFTFFNAFPFSHKVFGMRELSIFRFLDLVGFSGLSRILMSWRISCSQSGFQNSRILPDFIRIWVMFLCEVSETPYFIVLNCKHN
jgi:hypothetical protein